MYIVSINITIRKTRNVFEQMCKISYMSHKGNIDTSKLDHLPPWSDEIPAQFHKHRAAEKKRRLLLHP